MVVAVFFGGKSCEHDISVITGVQAMQALGAKHTLVPVYIDRAGAWWTHKGFKTVRDYLDGKVKLKRVYVKPACPCLFTGRGKKIKTDGALLALHGAFGEDGSIQGALRLSNIPYTGSNVRASAVGMDKITMKLVFSALGLPVVPYAAFTAEELESDFYGVAERIGALGFPLMVKPSNLGSSIGISKVKDNAGLYAAVEVALKWDSRVLVEKALEDFTELNCAVMGGERELRCSGIEKPVGWQDFLSFEDKYLSKSKGLKREFPAQLAKEDEERIYALSKAAFRAVGASGVARVDFMKKDGELFVNEINTIPGALSNYLFPDTSFDRLIDELLQIALDNKKSEDKLCYTYASPIAKAREAGPKIKR